MRLKKLFRGAAVLFWISVFSYSSSGFAKTVKYELLIERKLINLSGKKAIDFALTVNGSIPAPILEFTEGDDAEILVKNAADEETSVHWHGILLPPEMDGVPYVTTPPILPGQSYLFKFKIRQNGTYWYHSHTNVQEQKGVYGAIVIHPKEKKIKYDKDLVVVLSDWSDENATQILSNLKKDGDYYLYKKDSLRSYFGALQAKSLGNHLSNEWSRMGGMDLSDVGYDAFLINGKSNLQLLEARLGEKIRIRIINAAASSYFYVRLGQGPMRVISADGVDIDPIVTSDILMGMAETYDVLFEVPENKNYELRATAQAGTGFASGWIGAGEKVTAKDRPAPDMYATTNHGGDHGGHGGHVGHDMHAGHYMAETLTVDDIRSEASTELPKNKPIYDLKLVLGGDMERYVWHINGKAVHEDRNIFVNEGDVVRFTFANETMMHHPMHLHGHFFRVLNKYGEKSPLKHTVDVPPHSTRVIEFYANEPGEWMLHCHNLYHMKTGMARVVKYMSYKPRPEIEKIQHFDHHLHEHWYYYGSVKTASNLGEAKFRATQTWSAIEGRFEAQNQSPKPLNFNEPWEYEGDLLYRRWLNQYFSFLAGGTGFDNELSGLGGVSYILPMLIESRAFLTHKGRVRLDLEKHFQWTKVIFSDVEYRWRSGEKDSHANDFNANLMYSQNWAWAAGLTFTNASIGVGFQTQF